MLATITLLGIICYIPLLLKVASILYGTYCVYAALHEVFNHLSTDCLEYISELLSFYSRHMALSIDDHHIQ